MPTGPRRSSRMSRAASSARTSSGVVRGIVPVESPWPRWSYSTRRVDALSPLRAGQSPQLIPGPPCNTRQGGPDPWTSYERPDGERRRSGAALPAEPWVKRVTQTLTNEVCADHQSQDRDARQRADVVRDRDDRASVGEHRAPVRRRRLRAETDEAEAGGLRDHPSDVQARRDERGGE